MFLGLADNIFVDTPGPGNTGAAGWVPQSGGVLSTVSVDWITGRAWNNGITTPGALFACARATPVAAYYQNADLTLSTFAANVLRYGTNGLLIEGTKTNLCLQSQTLDNGAWTPTAVTISPNVIAAPDGTLTADKLQEDNTNSIHKLQPTASFAAAVAQITHSVYAKAAERTWIIVFDKDNSNVGAWFNLVGSGSVGTTQGANQGATITALADGWYRCTITFTVGAGATAGVAIAVATADNVSTYTGTTGSGAYFWGAQAEQPVVASSYIPTTTVAVTRANELITANSVAFINATAGTVYAVFNVSNSGSPRILGRNSGGVSVLYLNGLTNFADFPTANNLQAANTYTAGTNGKGAASYAATARSIVLNGGTVAVDNVNGIGTFDSFQLGADVGGGNYLNGYLRNISYWNTRLSDAAIQTLTT